MKYFIKTFGCQQNKADSERIDAAFMARGMKQAKEYEDANYVIINTCMVRESAENRVYGLVENLEKIKLEKQKEKKLFKIIVTGCMVGLAFRDKTGKYLKRIREIMPEVDEFLPIEEIGFDNQPVRQNATHGLIPISNGCNNFCTFCVVPFTRGREISRPYTDIVKEAMELKAKGYTHITLLGQNVNSYGADLLVGEKNIQVMRDIENTTYFNSKLKIENYKPIYVKHLGRYRIPTLFPILLEQIAKMGFISVDFISSNPWDFSDELIDVIARNKNISRTIHLPIQSGDNSVLKRMNRWYTRNEYLKLISKLKYQIPNIKLTTDIIVGFCGETDKEFQNTVDICKKVGYEIAFISMYSSRFGTAATKVFQDDIPHSVKRKRWLILENLINKPHLQKNHKLMDH